MLKLIRIFFLCLMPMQIAFADICDFEYSGDYYAESTELPSNWIPEQGTPFDGLAINESRTNTYTNSNGEKSIRIFTLLDDGCFKMEETRINSSGEIIISFSYVMKQNHILQITSNDTVINVNHSNTPCKFTLVGRSGEKTDFHFKGEYERLFDAKKNQSSPLFTSN